MRQSILIIVFLFFYGLATSQIPTNYYNTTDGKTGYDLKTALHHIIKDHQEQSYKSLWTHFRTTDKKPNNTVWDMYSDVPGGSPAYVYTFGTDQCGNYSGEGSCYNREHSWPKSWFNDGKPMYSDLFHLYPTDGYTNSKRGNFPFGEVNSPSWTSTNGCKVGNNSTEGYSSTVFEPIDEYKGDFARSYFYMATRYENIIASWANNNGATEILNGTNDQVFKQWHLNLLLSWHQQDPVSQKEIDRNNAVYGIQNNRNPFIDHPEYVEMIWDPGQPSGIILLSENFESLTSGNDIQITNWLNLAKKGTILWKCSDHNNNQFAELKSYQEGENENEAWLVTKSIPLSEYQNAQLSFSINGGFDNGATLQVFVIKNYTTGSNPWDSELVNLTYNIPNIPTNTWGTWGSSGIIDLSAYKEDIRIAFKYSGGEGINQTTTWQIDNVLINAETKPNAINSEQLADYSIYPNPSKGIITIEGEFTEASNTIYLYNNQGQLIHVENKENFNKIQLSLPQLPKGMYYLKIQSKTKQYKSKKIILN